ncbi:MAG: hypothetical protein ACKV22_01730 [Bryobacteraceae bacterium]
MESRTKALRNLSFQGLLLAIPLASFGAGLSSDSGQTWGDEIILRQDGGNWDLGYSRSVQRPDGKIVTVYDSPDKERYNGGTIWDPGKDSGTAQ